MWPFVTGEKKRKRQCAFISSCSRPVCATMLRKFSRFIYDIALPILYFIISYMANNVLVYGYILFPTLIRPYFKNKQKYYTTFYKGLEYLQILVFLEHPGTNARNNKFV